MFKIILLLSMSLLFIPLVYGQGGTVGGSQDGDDPIMGLDCPSYTHTWNAESQRCDIKWNSLYVVIAILVIIILVILIIIGIIIFKRRN